MLLFAIMHSMPGDPIQLIAGDRADPQKIVELREKFGLDKPYYIQYLKWLGNILHRDFGLSILASQPVGDLIMSRFKYTLMLSGVAILIQYFFAIPIALFAAFKKDSMFDKFTVYSSIVFWSTPQFMFGILLILLFAIKFPIFPISGYSGALSLVLPVATIALTSMASGIRVTRSEIVDILNEKYIVTAYAKGLREKAILIR